MKKKLELHNCFCVTLAVPEEEQCEIGVKRAISSSGICGSGGSSGHW